MPGWVQLHSLLTEVFEELETSLQTYESRWTKRTHNPWLLANDVCNVNSVNLAAAYAAASSLVPTL